MLVEPFVSLFIDPLLEREADYRPYLGIFRTYDTRCYPLCDRMLHLPIQVSEVQVDSTITIIPNATRYTHSLLARFHSTLFRTLLVLMFCL